MSDDQKTTLRNIIFTLNTISVSGSDNMDKLLGCIQVLNRMLTDESEKGGSADD